MREKTKGFPRKLTKKDHMLFLGKLVDYVNDTKIFKEKNEIAASYSASLINSMGGESEITSEIRDKILKSPESFKKELNRHLKEDVPVIE